MKYGDISLSTEFINHSPQELYEAWREGEEMQEGQKFETPDGYLWGEVVKLEPGERIVHSVRSRDFPADAEAARTEVKFEKKNGGTRMTVTHEGVPEAQREAFEASWKKHFDRPMKRYL